MTAAQRKTRPQAPPGTVGTDGLPWNPFNVVADIQADLWANDKLSGAIEMALCIWIWRATWGNAEIDASEKPEAFAPPTSMAKLAKQLNTSADLVFRAIKRLRTCICGETGKEAGIIVSDPKDDKGGKPLRLKLTPRFWHQAPAYKPNGLHVVEMPASPEEGCETEDERQQILAGMEEFFAEPSKPAIIGVSRQVGKIRLETPDFLDVRSRWQGHDLVLRVANKGDAVPTSDLQVGGSGNRQKSSSDLQVGGSSTPAVECETLRAGLKLGGDTEFLEKLFRPLAKAKESAAGFVAFVQYKQSTRKSPILRQYLPKILAEFLATPPAERSHKPENTGAAKWRELRAKGWTIDQIRLAYKLEPPEDGNA